MRTSTFTDHRLDVEHASLALSGLGFDVEESCVVRRVVLDTFDGRLHAAGMQLEAVTGHQTQLVLQATGSLPASLPVLVAPRFASELPAGPFRSRLAAVTDVRALLPLVEFEDRQSPASLRDRDGRVVVSALIHPPLGALPWTIDVTELPGQGKHAEWVRRELELRGFEPVDDVATLTLASLGIDAAGYASVPGVDMRRDDPAATSFARVLANLLDAVEHNWDGVIDDIDTEFLHEFRVALRRSRAVVGHGRDVLGADVVTQYSPRLASLALLTGPNRDIDVHLLGWSNYVTGFDESTAAALDPVLEHLRRHRSVTHTELVAALRSEGTLELLASWRQVLVAISSGEQPGGSAAADSVGSVVAKRLVKTHRRLLADGRAIRDDSPAEDLHELRKDAKKLRYLVECFADLFPTGERKKFIRDLKGLQDNLGQHQDADIHATQLRRVALEMSDEHASRTSLLAVGQLTEQLDHSMRAARSEFDGRFADYDSQSTRDVVAEMARALAP